jgi:MerR family transcriptional regulator, aldehyde-responsive regulator
MDTSVNRTLTPAEMADRTGVTIDTLRYYEKENLLVGVRRADNGHRRYREDDVGWVEVLRCLRLSGMSIEQLRQYCALGEQGVHTEPERYALLIEHRRKVEEAVAELHVALGVIDHKLDIYRTALGVKGTS